MFESFFNSCNETKSLIENSKRMYSPYNLII
jgi:hypothetical protein